MESMKTDELVLVRCIVKKEMGDYFKAEDYNGKKYIIEKNHVTRKFKKGTDETFYALKRTAGIFFKKQVLSPISGDEFQRIYKEEEK